MGKVKKATEPSKDEKPRKNVKKVSSYKKPSYKKKIFTKGGKQGKDSKTGSESSPASTGEKWSKSKKKRMRQIMGRQKKEEAGDKRETKNTAASDEATPLPNSPNPSTPATTTTTPNDTKKKNSMQEGFKARLAGSRFRILNEELYTTTSKNSYNKFKENPELFEQYHEGFRHQVESWPENPVDVMVRSLTSTYQKKTQKATAGPCVVADFGCGDAQLAKDLLAVKRINRNGETSDEILFDVHSFDLVSPNELVTACDMADVPMEDKSADVCVFCLSLMGTNLADFIREAHRVLKDDGRVKIAEVRSRIEYSFSKNGKNSKTESSSAGNAKEKTEGTLEEFTGVLAKLGFECIQTDRTNTMFLMLELKKNRRRPNKKLAFSAKPCIYKRR
jgi:ribosomal RNA-processing protein 8